MITLLAVNIGLPVVFLAFRLVSHAVDPKSYGPAGGYSIFTTLVAGVLFIFGFIVAATVGCTAGSVDLTEGMFRHLVITGRSRLALYLARIPAGLAIVLPIVAVGFAIVCTVCILAAPTQLNYDGIKVPAGLSQPALDSWATAHADEVICNFGFDIGPNSDLLQVVNSVPCGNGNGPGIKVGPGRHHDAPVSHAQVEAAARQIANLDYFDYHRNFLEPPTTPDDRLGSVGPPGGDHRLRGGPRTGVAHGPADGAGHPHDRPRGHPDPGAEPKRHPPPDQRPARHRRSGHEPSGTRRPTVTLRGQRTERADHAGARVAYRGRLRDRRLAGGVDGARGLADGDEGRLSTSGRSAGSVLRPPPHGHRWPSGSVQSASVAAVATGCPLAFRVTSMFPRVALE